MTKSKNSDRIEALEHRMRELEDRVTKISNRPDPMRRYAGLGDIPWVAPEPLKLVTPSTSPYTGGLTITCIDPQCDCRYSQPVATITPLITRCQNPDCPCNDS